MRKHSGVLLAAASLATLAMTSACSGQSDSCRNAVETINSYVKNVGEKTDQAVLATEYLAMVEKLKVIAGSATDGKEKEVISGLASTDEKSVGGAIDKVKSVCKA